MKILGFPQKSRSAIYDNGQLESACRLSHVVELAMCKSEDHSLMT